MTTTFRVYGTEFCRVLGAVALFQASPRAFESLAAVRCFARYDGLSLIAINGASVAVGHVEAEDIDEPAVFSIPAAQVKAILAIFNRRLPKDASSMEYVLEVTVTDQQVRIHDVSDLFERDEYLMAITATEDLEAREQSDAERAMRAAATAMSALRATDPFDLAAGVYFSHDEIARMARAAKLLTLELHLRPAGRFLVAALADDFVAMTVAQRHDRDPEKPRIFIDEQALRSWRGRLDELVDQAVL